MLLVLSYHIRVILIQIIFEILIAGYMSEFEY